MDKITVSLYEMIISPSKDLRFVGFNHVRECQAWVDKTFPYYVIQYAESGELDLRVNDGKAMRLVGPVAWLTAPGPRFRFGVKDDGAWRHRFVSFQGALADAYARRGLYPLSTPPVITITDPARFTATFDTLLQRLGDNGARSDYRSIHILEDLLLQLHEQPEPKSQKNPAKSRIENFIAEIERQPEEKFDLKNTARKLGLSYSHFRKLFRELRGTPPGQYILDRRLAKAADMLRNTESGIADIADVCGFHDVFHFSKQFKKKYGLPPGEYRKHQFPWAENVDSAS